jgi:hypothetical protein
MKKLIAAVMMLTGVLLVAAGCADETSTEACLHETSLALDQGNYDGVLASSCANSMQRGAAYFGRAGFDITSVVNRFIDAGETDAAQTDLNIYMTSMIGRVTEATLNDLDRAKTEYTAVLPASDIYRDAQFNISIVDVVKSLSLLKLVMDADGLGTVDTGCDANGNGEADEVDAARCVLLTSAGQVCNSGVTVDDDVFGISLQNRSFAGYRGIVITVSGAGADISACPSPNQYKKLLYFQGASWLPATTTADLCQETAPGTLRTWPCPVESGGEPLDLVGAVDESLNSSISAMNTAITTTQTTLQQSIFDIKQQNCCIEEGSAAWNPADPSSCACSAEELAAYMLTI